MTTAKRRGRYAFAVCQQCSASFERNVYDLARSKRQFCSTACRNAGSARGRTLVLLACDGCDEIFSKVLTFFRRSRRHYCSIACWGENVDPVELGRQGGKAPHRWNPEAARERGRRGGRARALVLSRERLQEIGRLGVKARMERLSAAQRSAIARRASVTRTGVKRYFGVNVLPVRERES